MIWDINAVSRGLKAIDGCRQELLAHLKCLLDDYHHWDRPLSYYEILSGDWLLHFSHVTYAAMVEVENMDGVNELTPIPVSADLVEHCEMRLQKSWHAHLRGSIVSLLKGESPQHWRFQYDSVHAASEGKMQPANRLLKSICSQNPKVLMVAPYIKCGPGELLKTFWRWRGWVGYDALNYPTNILAIVDKKWRTTKASDAATSTDLCGLLKTLLPLHLPVALLEGFSQFRTSVLDMPVARPKILYSANALHGNLTFKLLAAEWRDEGTRLFYHQHGGGYGLDQIHAIESYEIQVADRYFTWGWSTDNPRVRPLSPAMPRAKSTRRVHIMLNCVDFPQVVYRVHFHPMPGTIQILHRETYSFLRSFVDQKKLLVRPYPHDYDWGVTEMMKKAAPDAMFDNHRLSSFDRYSQCRLIVHNYLGTSFLETLALNIPTLCFFDSDTYAFRASAQPLMAALESVGILHRSGNGAATFVAGLSKDIEGWWNKPEVQEARHAFVKIYANFSSNWVKLWEDEFHSALAD